MRILLFAYDLPHRPTCELLTLLRDLDADPSGGRWRSHPRKARA